LRNTALAAACPGQEGRLSQVSCNGGKNAITLPTRWHDAGKYLNVGLTGLIARFASRDQLICCADGPAWAN
jgi:hypothetical protein